jgi:hypothetical protein
VINAIQKFKESVAPGKTHIESLFPLILVFGGDVDPRKDKHQSCRNIFLQWAQDTKYELADFLRYPEEFKEWNNIEGYPNLVEFEKDAGCLSRGILLFSECPGAFAELGVFCTDEVLCERLLVVLADEHYDVPFPSFIRLGPVKLIEDKHTAKAICTVNSTTDKHAFEKEVVDVGKALKDIVEAPLVAKLFNANRTRDQFLLIADLVELFGALTDDELGILLSFMGVNATNLKRMLNQLILFELIIKSSEKTGRYYVPPKQCNPLLDYTAPAGSAFDRAAFKLKAIDTALKRDKNRLKAYEKIHGVRRWI